MDSVTNALAEMRRRRSPDALGERDQAGPARDDGAPTGAGEMPRRHGDASGGAEQEALRRIIARLAAEGEGLDDEAQRALAKGVVAAEAGALGRARMEAIEREVTQSLGGRLGLLQPLLDDPTVTEIMVNAPDQVFVERQGRIERADVRFRDDRSVQALVERVVAPLGRSFSVAHPLVDARLADGSRLNAVRPPISLLGTTVTIRRFPRSFSLAELVDTGAFGDGRSWSEPEAAGLYPAGDRPWAVLAWCVRHRVNIVVSGGTGSGKTTVLGALTQFIPPTERVVFIEDAAELQPRLPHVVRLEARQPNAEGAGAVPIHQLVVNALRMRPDRIVVGEVRDIEALDMLVAMNTGHDGSLTTIHANSPREVFRRLVQATTLRAAGGTVAAEAAVVGIAAAAIGLVVQVARHGTRRRVESLVAVEGLGPDGEPRLRRLFGWDRDRLAPSGEAPVWAPAAQARGETA